jgi:hypothetical protein
VLRASATEERDEARQSASVYVADQRVAHPDESRRRKSISDVFHKPSILRLGSTGEVREEESPCFLRIIYGAVEVYEVRRAIAVVRKS